MAVFWCWGAPGIQGKLYITWVIAIRDPRIQLVSATAGTVFKGRFVWLKLLAK